VTAVGENTGSLPSFDVGRQKFPTLIDCKLPVWDMKGMLIAKTAGTSGVQLQVFDQNSGDDSVLMDITVSQAELPDPSAGWVEFVKKSDGATTSDAMAAMELVFRLKVTPGDERIGSAEAAAACFAGNDGKCKTGGWFGGGWEEEVVNTAAAVVHCGVLERARCSESLATRHLRATGARKRCLSANPAGTRCLPASRAGERAGERAVRAPLFTPQPPLFTHVCMRPRSGVLRAGDDARNRRS